MFISPPSVQICLHRGCSSILLTGLQQLLWAPLPISQSCICKGLGKQHLHREAINEAIENTFLEWEYIAAGLRTDILYVNFQNNISAMQVL